MLFSKKISVFSFVLLLMLSTLCFSLTTLAESESETSQQESTELDLTRLFVEDTFCYRNLSWKITAQEVMEQAGISLTQLDRSIPNYYISDETVSLQNEIAVKVQYEFQPDRSAVNQTPGPDSGLAYGLEVISFYFEAEDDKDLTELLNATVDSLENICGKTEKTEFPKGNALGYRWFSTNHNGQETSLQIQANCHGKRITDFRLSVGIVTPPDTAEDPAI